MGAVRLLLCPTRIALERAVLLRLLQPKKHRLLGREAVLDVAEPFIVLACHVCSAPTGWSLLVRSSPCAHRLAPRPPGVGPRTQPLVQGSEASAQREQAPSPPPGASPWSRRPA